MCSTPEIFEKKLRFIEKYNPTKTVEAALSSSFDAALQRNPIYNKDASTFRRKEIKAFCSSELLRISRKYIDVVTVKEYENDILELQSLMNERYHAYFDENGFKISHSQKSLSVFLKIMWLIGKIKMPPLCPVDRTILIAAGEKNPDAWTSVNSMPEYRKHIRILKHAARNHKCPNLACWEIYHFKVEDK
ncbi:hypothetical protein [Dyadobacter psychrophilus]|uniref:Uncharacterized protein n=1 Tax=Dyadobacter psychrophilus TaxID=651661 RepID=A0A1T5HGK2_9BACT|nr:hypothetical protein [Dyadobacter psychrophilus]SKC19631.1 hypothetical protein SAMN05660293_05502 [Dyadobacter psychrophilus]